MYGERARSHPRVDMSSLSSEVQRDLQAEDVDVLLHRLAVLLAALVDLRNDPVCRGDRDPDLIPGPVPLVVALIVEELDRSLGSEGDAPDRRVPLELRIQPKAPGLVSVRSARAPMMFMPVFSA